MTQLSHHSPWFVLNWRAEVTWIVSWHVSTSLPVDYAQTGNRKANMVAALSQFNLVRVIPLGRVEGIARKGITQIRFPQLLPT
jgi:hypothetical protein